MATRTPPGRTGLIKLVDEISRLKRPEYVDEDDFSDAPPAVKRAKTARDTAREIIRAWNEKRSKAYEERVDKLHAESRRIRLVIETGTLDEARKAIEAFERAKF
jgi:hypothetical protein